MTRSVSARTSLTLEDHRKTSPNPREPTGRRVQRQARRPGFCGVRRVRRGPRRARVGCHARKRAPNCEAGRLKPPPAAALSWTAAFGGTGMRWARKIVHVSHIALGLHPRSSGRRKLGFLASSQCLSSQRNIVRSVGGFRQLRWRHDCHACGRAGAERTLAVSTGRCA